MPDRPPNLVNPTWSSIRAGASIERQLYPTPMTEICGGTVVRVGVPPIPLLGVYGPPTVFTGVPSGAVIILPRFMRLGRQ